MKSKITFTLEFVASSGPEIQIVNQILPEKKEQYPSLEFIVFSGTFPRLWHGPFNFTYSFPLLEEADLDLIVDPLICYQLTEVGLWSSLSL